jgi:signal transduction histidine kinase
MPPQKFEIITGIVVTIIVFLLAGFFILVLVAYINRRKKKHMEEKQMMQSSFHQELLQTQLEIQEQTLKTISQEIHDNIGQVLSLAKLNLNTIDITRKDDLLEKIDSSKQLVSKAIQDLRDLSKSLNTDNIAAIGLLRAIGYELDMIRKAGEHKTSLEIMGNAIRPDPQKELIVFRIVQELLNNIIKHAAATNIKVEAHYTNTELELIISDDGKGFNLESMNKEDNNGSGQGLGIRNMHNRARLIGAGFSMQSLEGQGTTVKLKLPVNM